MNYPSSYKTFKYYLNSINIAVFKCSFKYALILQLVSLEKFRLTFSTFVLSCFCTLLIIVVGFRYFGEILYIAKMVTFQNDLRHVQFATFDYLTTIHLCVGG